MITLPAAYAWLDNIPGPPKMIVEARALYGTHEGVGAADNPEILAWAKEVGFGNSYQHDQIAWCGLFAALIAHRAGKPVPAAPLWALNWKSFGTPQSPAGLGDILVFERRDGRGKLIGGHVGFYIGEDATAYHVLGGNEGDMVNIVRIAKTRCVAVRRPIWSVSQPASVKPHILAESGTLSKNEA